MTEKIKSRSHGINMIFPLILLCVFVLCAVTLILFAAGVYRLSASQESENYSTRTSLSYLTEKIRQGNGEAVVDSFGDGDAIVLFEEDGGQVFKTWLYVHDGTLRELFIAEGTGAGPESGTEVMELDAMDVEARGDNLLYVRCEKAGLRTAEGFISLR